MTIIQSLILGIVEGLSEYLPISSTGHLILASNLLSIVQSEFTKTFEIFIQLGAILAVIILYWKTFLKDKDYWKKIVIAFIPTGIIGLILYKFIKHYLLGNSLIVVITLFLGGIILILIEQILKRNEAKIKTAGGLGYKEAFLIGLFQSISIIPGVSRSAATIVGGLILGMKRESAVEFSFILAVPTLVAATTLDLVKSNLAFTAPQYLSLLIGFISSFITAVIAIKYFISFVKEHTFIPFGIYRIIIAVLFFLFVLR
jgi:undecaprenyl-diphosphatase